MRLEDLAGYIQQRGLGTAGKDLFVHEMPDTCKAGVMLMQPGGSMVNQYMPEWFDTEFRLVVRHTDYTQGITRARQLFRALTLRQEVVLPGMTIRQCLPLNQPAGYRRSVGGFWEFEVEFSVVFIDHGI